jgi:hypothetical protein
MSGVQQAASSLLRPTVTLQTVPRPGVDYASPIVRHSAPALPLCQLALTRPPNSPSLPLLRSFPRLPARCCWTLRSISNCPFRIGFPPFECGQTPLPPLENRLNRRFAGLLRSYVSRFALLRECASQKSSVEPRKNVLRCAPLCFVVLRALRPCEGASPKQAQSALRVLRVSCFAVCFLCFVLRCANYAHRQRFACICQTPDSRYFR